MNLLVNGCSYSFGINKTLDHYVYSNQMAEHFDSVHNISLAGKSNDRIVRTTLDFCKTNNMNDFYVIIQWTSPYRNELFNEKTSQWLAYNTNLNTPTGKLKDTNKKYIFVDVNMEDQQAMKIIDESDYSEEFARCMDNEIRYMRSINDFYVDFYKNVIILQDYFEKHNIKYLFSGMADDSFPIKNSYQKMIYNDLSTYTSLEKHLKDMIISNKWSKKHFAEMMQSNTVSQNDGHPNEKGHKLIAQALYRDLMEIYG